MRLSGYQPQYFPRLHYFNRAIDSDVFEISDYLQFVKKHAFLKAVGTYKRDKSFQAHTPIKLDSGIYYLSIPTHTHGDLFPINKTSIDYSQNWRHKHLKSIETGYSKSPNFLKFFPEIEEILLKEYKSLADLNIKTILWGLTRFITDEKINIGSLTVVWLNQLLTNTKLFRLKNIFLASESPVPLPEKGEANDWIIKLCKYADSDEYYYGSTSHVAYMDLSKFAKSGIKTTLQDWHCLPYSQQYMSVGFLPNLSIIDLIMNQDLKKRQNVIQGDTN